MKTTKYFILLFLITGIIVASRPYMDSVRSKMTSFFIDPSIPFSSSTSYSQQSLEFQTANLSWQILILQDKLQSMTQFREKFSQEKVPYVVPVSIFKADDVSSFVCKFWIDRGSTDGISVGCPVVSGKVFLGKVAKVTPNASLCVHVSDPTMRLGIYIVDTPNIKPLDSTKQSENDPIPYAKGLCFGKNGICQLRNVEKGFKKWSSGILNIITGDDNPNIPLGLVIGTIQSPYKENSSKNVEEKAGMFWDLKVDIPNIQDYKVALVLLK